MLVKGTTGHNQQCVINVISWLSTITWSADYPQQICISPAPGRSSKLTYTGVEIGTMCIPDMLSVVQCSHGHVIGVAFFWRDFSGVKRTCWTTGSWRSCLSLEVVSSIPAWSTIIYRFLCGFICVSLCQSIKIKPTNTKLRDYLK